MFYSEDLLSRTGALGHVWLASNMEKKLSRNEFLRTDISSSVNTIVDESTVPLALRLSGQLLLGVVRIYNRKTIYLMEDCNETLLKLKMAFRTGNVDMEKPTVTVAKSHTLTLQNKITDLDLLLLPEPNFDLGLPEFGDTTFSSASGATRRPRHHRVEEPMLMSSQHAPSASHRDITLPDMDDTIDMGRGFSHRHDMDDLSGTDDLGLDLDLDLDLGLDLETSDTSKLHGQGGDYDDSGMGHIDMGAGDNYEDLLAEGRARRIGDGSSDIETGLAASVHRSEGDELDLRRQLELAISGEDLNLPSSTRDHDESLGLPPSSPRVPGSPGSPEGPRTPTEGADILGDIEVTTDLGADETARRSILGEEEKGTTEQSQALPRRRRRPRPQHAGVDAMIEIETSKSQLEANRKLIVRQRSSFPTDFLSFSLMEMNQKSLMASMFVYHHDNPLLARLVDPDFVNSRMNEVSQHQSLSGRKRAISELSDFEEGFISKTMRIESPSLDANLDITSGEHLDQEGGVEPTFDQEFNIADFPGAKRIGEETEQDHQKRDTEADREQYEHMEPGFDTFSGPGYDYNGDTEAGFGNASVTGKELGLDLELEPEDSESYSTPGISGISQYTIKAATSLKESLEKQGLAPSTEELQEIKRNQPKAYQPPPSDKNPIRSGVVNFESLVQESMLTASGEPKKSAKSAHVKMFFEMLVLATKDAVKLEQPHAFGDISVRPKEYLYNDIWEGKAKEQEQQQEAH